MITRCGTHSTELESTHILVCPYGTDRWMDGQTDGMAMNNEGGCVTKFDHDSSEMCLTYTGIN